MVGNINVNHIMNSPRIQNYDKFHTSFKLISIVVDLSLYLNTFVGVSLSFFANQQRNG